MIRRIDLRLASVQLPETVPGMSREQQAGEGREKYVVAINEDLCDLERAAAFIHEMLHIYHNDFQDDRPAFEVEKERRKELIQLLRLLVEEDKRISLAADPYKMSVVKSAFEGRGECNGKH